MGNKTGNYLITGATGFLGNILTEYLVGGGSNVTIIVRDINRCSENIRKMISDGLVSYYVRDITDNGFVSDFMEHESGGCGNKTGSADCVSGGSEIFPHIDYIIHLAATTQSKKMIEKPVDVADGIVMGTRSMLELARRLGVKSMLYVSSMEVYGTVKDNGTRITERELGDIDIFSARSCYPMGKRMAEQYCYDYYSQYGVPVKIARLAQTFGTGISPDDNRVFMQFVRAVLEKRDIVLKTEGMSFGNYCETMDAVRGMLTLLDKGVDGEAYNIVNEESTMRIREMAEMVAERIAEGKISVVYDIEDAQKTGYAADTELRLSGEKLRKLGWKPVKNLEMMYRDMLEEVK